MPVFKPDLYVRSFKELNIGELKKRNIKLLLCDVDNTLVAFDDPKSNQEVRAFFDMLAKNGIQCALMSNNISKRVNAFAKNTGIQRVYSFSCKPFPFTFKKAMKEHQVEAANTAILGDQLFTDILGGTISGITTILSAPIVNRERADTKIMRFFENRMYRYYEKHNILKRGNFDE